MTKEIVDMLFSDKNFKGKFLSKLREDVLKKKYLYKSTIVGQKVYCSFSLNDEDQKKMQQWLINLPYILDITTKQKNGFFLQIELGNDFAEISQQRMNFYYSLFLSALRTAKMKLNISVS